MDDRSIGSDNTQRPGGKDPVGDLQASLSDAATMGGGSEHPLGRIDRYELLRELGGGASAGYFWRGMPWRASRWR